MLGSVLRNRLLDPGSVRTSTGPVRQAQPRQVERRGQESDGAVDVRRGIKSARVSVPGYEHQAWRSCGVHRGGLERTRFDLLRVEQRITLRNPGSQAQECGSCTRYRSLLYLWLYRALSLADRRWQPANRGRAIAGAS